MASTSSQPARAPSFFYYVPNEICVAVSLDQDRHIGDERWRALAYERLQNFLNTRLAELLDRQRAEQPAAGSEDDLWRDFRPSLALEYAARERERERVELQPLSREMPGLSPVLILRYRDGRATALHFYQIGPERLLAQRWIPENAAIVRELVNLINSNLQQQRFDEVPGTILAATPNWLFPAANGSGYTGGGPANDPKPAPAPEGEPEPYRFQFANADLRKLVERQRRADPLPEGQEPKVVVAVLDTCPDPDVVHRKAETTDNWLLKEVAEKVKLDDPLFVLPSYFDFLAGIDPGHGDKPSNGISHDIPDHGLFAAGIIRDIAPTAEIHLIRVLGPTGIGDLLLLINVLAKLPAHLAPTGRRLVINLSLMAGLPVNEELPKCWCPEAAKRSETLLQLWSTMSATFALIHTSLAQVITWLEDQGVLVVAAAGNDASRHVARPEPRFPARYDTVLGVAAVNADQQPSAFSNQGDFTLMGNGVAVFGGDLAGKEVVGIFSQPEFPFMPPGTKNETGWAYWSGTSFSTPVLTAIAADVWTECPGLTPDDLIVITTRPSDEPGALPWDPPGVRGRFAVKRLKRSLACYVIEASQDPR